MPHMQDNTFMLKDSTDWYIDFEKYSSRESTNKLCQPVTVLTFDVYKSEGFETPEGCVIHEKLEIELKHASMGNTVVNLRVHYNSYIRKVEGKRKRVKEVIPFRVDGCLYTHHFRSSICAFMADYGLTMKKCAHTFLTTPKIVKDINKWRLAKLCGDMKPRHISHHIAVDEFLIEHGHRYCTIIIDADTGELLYLEKGKKKEQLNHFFEWVGPEFMNQVRAISMDMNTNYSSAVKERYPDIAITYDSFHIIQWFNKGVIDSIRKSASKDLLKQAEKLKEKGRFDEAEYLLEERKLLFSNRFTLLANQKTLEAKDKLNRELNKAAKEEAKLNGRDPSEVGKRREDNAESRAKLLNASESIATCIKAREELQDILKSDDETAMGKRLTEWIALYSKAGITQLTKFTSTMVNRFDGIVSKARFHLSSGILEGTNAFIKNLRRSSFGLVDFDYFAYLIWERTHGPNKRRSSSGSNGKPLRKYKRLEKPNKKVLKHTVYDWKGEMDKRETA